MNAYLTVDKNPLPFRPDSVGHFKEVARNVAWYLALPLQAAQELLSRIYGYEGLHELQKAQARDGEPGPYSLGGEHPIRCERSLAITYEFLGKRLQEQERDQLAERIEMLTDLGIFKDRETCRARFKLLKRRIGSEKGGSPEWPTEDLEEWFEASFYLEEDFNSTALEKLRLAAPELWDGASVEPFDALECLKDYLFPLVYLRTGPIFSDPHPDLPKIWAEFLYGAEVSYQDFRFEALDEISNEAFTEYLLNEVLPRYPHQAIGQASETSGKSGIDDPSGEAPSVMRYLDDVPEGAKLRIQWAAGFKRAAARLHAERAFPQEVLRWDRYLVIDEGEHPKHIEVLIHFAVSEWSSEIYHDMRGMNLWTYCASFWVEERGNHTPLGLMRGRYISPVNGAYRASNSEFKYFMDADSDALSDVWKVLEYEYFREKGWASVEEFVENSEEIGIATATLELLPKYRGRGLTPELLELFADAIGNHPFSGYACLCLDPYLEPDDEDNNAFENYAARTRVDLPAPKVFLLPIEGAQQGELTSSLRNPVIREAPIRTSESRDNSAIERRRRSLVRYFTSIKDKVAFDIVTYNPLDYPIT